MAAHDLDLILTLTGGLGAALVLGVVAQKIKLSPIVGYLAAGVVVGPFTPGFVAHGGLAGQLAEVGIILLMFGVGLHFRIAELLAVKKIALPGAFVGIATATALGVLVGKGAGWSTAAGVVFGLTIAVASTVVVLRVLADHGALDSPSGHTVVGWIVVEDLVTVLVLVLLPLFFDPHGENAERSVTDLMISVAIAALKIGALVALTFIAGRRLIPALLEYVAKTKSRELFTLAILVIALGVAVGSAKLFGASMALGAFLGGMAVGQSDFSSRAAADALPMRDAFAVLFFVSVGMQFDPSALVPNLALSAATLAVVMFGKPLSAYLVVRLFRKPTSMALPIAASLAQIGEFSFIVAALGRELGILPARATQAIVLASMVSITLNPIVFRWAQRRARA